MRPSQFLDLSDDTYTAYCLDEALFARALFEEEARREEGGQRVPVRGAAARGAQLVDRPLTLGGIRTALMPGGGGLRFKVGR